MSVTVNPEPLRRAIIAAEDELIRAYGGDYGAMAQAWPALVMVTLYAELDARERCGMARPFVAWLNETLEQRGLPFRLVRREMDHWRNTSPRHRPVSVPSDAGRRRERRTDSGSHRQARRPARRDRQEPGRSDGPVR